MHRRKLYGICLVKDEEDIIAQSLTYATRHCDKIFVLDNGSTDQTWDIVQSLGSLNPQIVAFGQTHKPYSDGLRSLVYNKFYSELSDDDWWLIQDSDEFLAEDPQPVIQTAVNEGADIIRSWQIQFYFTERDLQSWEQGRECYDSLIFHRRRYYLINWQEPRLFRNQPSRPWDLRISTTIPNGLKRLCKRRILNRHYQFRDPEQIGKRLRLRIGLPSFSSHVISSDWHSVIRDSRTLNCLKEDQPWHFSFSGLAFYYRIRLRRRLLVTIRGIYRRLIRRLWRVFDGAFAAFK